MHDIVIKNATIVDGTGKDRFVGDIAIASGLIAAIGDDVGPATREIDASGLIAAPGWVDVHTHYDGQVTWDPYLSPSSWHGVTTAVMGNCGVGFAPVRDGDKDFLIELMESVEDIPGTALHEGIDWKWESFPEYLDVLEAMPRAVDVAAMMPHCALRAYVLGEDAHEVDISESVMMKMADLTKEAMDAGAIGFSTSRTVLHSSRHGFVPGTYSHEKELELIAHAVGEAGHGMFQMVSDNYRDPENVRWMKDLSKETGRPITVLYAQTADAPHGHREWFEDAIKAQEDGAHLIPQVGCRPTGMLYGLQSSLHPFMSHPSYRPLKDKSLDEIVAAMRTPEVRAAILAEEPDTPNPIAKALMTRFEQMYPLGDIPDYEPAPETSAAAVAERERRTPAEVVYDWMLERDGKALMFVPLASYVEQNHDVIGEMMAHPASVIGLSDGGAHCGLICDASMPTYLVTHWARDRKRGATMRLEDVVKMQTQDTARTFGMMDRGVLAPGMKADINLFDFDKLTVHAPEMVNDLPANGRRLIQRATGYRYTIQTGVVTFMEGEATGELPGKLYRSHASEQKLAAE